MVQALDTPHFSDTIRSVTSLVGSARMDGVKSFHWFETLVILVALGSLWPVLLGWEDPAWRTFMYVMLAVMALLFLVNVVRMWRLGHRPTEDSDG